MTNDKDRYSHQPLWRSKLHRSHSCQQQSGAEIQLESAPGQSRQPSLPDNHPHQRATCNRKQRYLRRSTTKRSWLEHVHGGGNNTFNNANLWQRQLRLQQQYCQRHPRAARSISIPTVCNRRRTHNAPYWNKECSEWCESVCQRQNCSTKWEGRKTSKTA